MLRQAFSKSSLLPSTHMLRRQLLASLLATDCVQRLVSTNGSAAACRRTHSSLCSTTSTPQQPHARPASTRRVNPSLRQRRPHVNGEAVAFHISDLLPQQPQHPTAASPSAFEQQQSSSAAKREYDSDLIVVLDMDECMIHSLFLSNPMSAHVMAHQVQNRRRNTDEANGGVVDHFRIQLPDGGDLVHVNVRPGLREFLDHITDRYETHIFTAAMPVYANPILDQLDPDNTKFASRWYRQHCTFDERRNAYVKDLSALPLPDMSRTVLVDNNPLSFLSHPSNGILVSSFFNDPNDTTLAAVQNLLQELDEHDDDVRPILEHRFGLKEALEELGQKQEKTA